MSSALPEGGGYADAATAPILSGMYPDPSVCRVGEEYFLANSSFEYSPGVPLWHSRDLVSWHQIGNALTSDEQFPAGCSPSSRGIYAPTLRHHGGRFWLITTNIDDARGGHQIYHASDPAGPWSAPVCLTGLDGIDPDLAWDDAGTCLVTYCSWSQSEIGIRQVAVDPEQASLLEEPRWIWHGTGLAHSEGPHLYRRGDWWYLVIAEGGTDRGHVVSVARSRSPRGLSRPPRTIPSSPIAARPTPSRTSVTPIGSSVPRGRGRRCISARGHGAAVPASPSTGVRRSSPTSPGWTTGHGSHRRGAMSPRGSGTSRTTSPRPDWIPGGSHRGSVPAASCAACRREWSWVTRRASPVSPRDCSRGSAETTGRPTSSSIRGRGRAPSRYGSTVLTGTGCASPTAASRPSHGSDRSGRFSAPARCPTPGHPPHPVHGAHVERTGRHRTGHR
jgi:hypothetical protein